MTAALFATVAVLVAVVAVLAVAVVRLARRRCACPRRAVEPATFRVLEPQPYDWQSDDNRLAAR